MSDLFHDAIPLDFIQDVFKVMRRSNHHVFQVLTKRAERLAELSSVLDWPENVWTGVTVERSDYKRRIESLRMTGAVVKFISIEPLLDDLGELDLTGIDWVIVGGESGPGARPMQVGGSERSAISAFSDTCPSSSSSGAASIRRRPGEPLMAIPGIRCPCLRQTALLPLTRIARHPTRRESLNHLPDFATRSTAGSSSDRRISGQQPIYAITVSL